MQTDIKNKIQLNEIKKQLEELMNTKIIRIETINIPKDFGHIIKGLTKDGDYFYFNDLRDLEDKTYMDREIEGFIREYKRYKRNKTL